MRENRTYGSEGGEDISPPRPYQVALPASGLCNPAGRVFTQALILVNGYKL